MGEEVVVVMEEPSGIAYLKIVVVNWTWEDILAVTGSSLEEG